jgi:poly(A) polymerase
MANAGGKQLGLTNPLSTALPTTAEIDASAALVLELKRQNNYESDSETRKRYLSIQTSSIIFGVTTYLELWLWLFC